MKNIFKIWKEEYFNIFRDKGVMLIFFGAIIFYPIFYPTPYSNEILRDVPIAVVDNSKSAISRKLIRMIDANQFVKVAAKPISMENAIKKFNNKEVNGIVSIPKDFNKKISWNEQAQIQVFSDASYFLLYKQVLTGVYFSVATMSAGIEIRRMNAKGYTEKQAMAFRDPLPYISKPLFNSTGGYASYVVPAVLIVILQQTLLIGIGLLGGTEREKIFNEKSGEAETLLERVQSILGKAGAYFSIYLLNSIFFFGVLFKFHNYPMKGSILELSIFITPFLLAVIFMGLAISSFFKNREISMMILLAASIPSLFLTGFSWPVEAIPQWMRYISFLLPTTTGVDGFLKLNQMGAHFSEISFDWYILWGLVVFYFVATVLSSKGQKILNKN